MEEIDQNSVLIEIFNQLSTLSAHVYAIEELLLDKKIITENDLESKIEQFVDEVQDDEDAFSEDVNVDGKIIH